MAEIFQIQGKDSLVRIGQYAALNAVQSFDWSPSMNEEYFDEMGNANHTAYAITPEISGSFESTATGSTVAFLRRMIMKFNPATGLFEGYQAGMPGDADFASNKGKLTGVDLEGAVFDLIEPKKANELFTRSTLLPRCHLSSVSWRADTNGTATETYNFEGDLAEVYRAPYHDVESVPVVKEAGNKVKVPAALFDTIKPCGKDEVGDADETHVALYLMIDEVKVPESALTFEVTAGELTGVIAVDAAYPVTGEGRMSLFCYRAGLAGNTAASTMPQIEYPTTARFMRADDIDIFLVPESVDLKGAVDMNAVNLSTYHFLRVQSADMNVDLRREPLRQIKYNAQNTSVFYRAATFPLQVTASASVMETDLRDWAMITGKQAVTDDPLTLGDFENARYQLVFRYYVGGVPLQTMALHDARITGRGYRNGVGARAEVSWNLTGSDLTIQGADA